MTRVQIPPYTDRWMMGDRYGDITRIDSIQVDGKAVDRASVRLDKSGKIVRVILDDCQVI